MEDDNEQVEIEIKLHLASFTDFLKLKGFVGSIDTEDNLVNCFFDSEDSQLADAGWALRVRAKEGKGAVTVKGVASGEGMAVIREEIEAEIPVSRANEILNSDYDVMKLSVEPVAFIREKFPDINLAPLVGFKTNRQRKKFKLGPGDYTLEIDTTEFTDGTVDYELEVELKSRREIVLVEDSLRKIFDHLGIPFEQQTESKLVRALRLTGQYR